jgi:hypothetical protein
VARDMEGLYSSPHATHNYLKSQDV